MNVSASNLANADSAVGPDGQPYRARQVVFQGNPPAGQPYGQEIGGVRVAGVVQDPSPPKRIYDPSHPLADQQGYVTMPNVDPVAETVNMIAASRSYQRSEEHTSELQSLMRISYAVFCLKKKTKKQHTDTTHKTLNST